MLKRASSHAKAQPPALREAEVASIDPAPRTHLLPDERLLLARGAAVGRLLEQPRGQRVLFVRGRHVAARVGLHRQPRGLKGTLQAHLEQGERTAGDLCLCRQVVYKLPVKGSFLAFPRSTEQHYSSKWPRYWPC